MKKIFVVRDGELAYYILAKNRFELLKGLSYYDIGNDSDNNETFIICEVPEKYSHVISITDDDGSEYTLHSALVNHKAQTPLVIICEFDVCFADEYTMNLIRLGEDNF